MEGVRHRLPSVDSQVYPAVLRIIRIYSYVLHYRSKVGFCNTSLLLSSSHPSPTGLLLPAVRRQDRCLLFRQTHSDEGEPCSQFRRSRSHWQLLSHVFTETRYSFGIGRVCFAWASTHPFDWMCRVGARQRASSGNCSTWADSA